MVPGLISPRVCDPTALISWTLPMFQPTLGDSYFSNTSWLVQGELSACGWCNQAFWFLQGSQSVLVLLSVSLPFICSLKTCFRLAAWTSESHTDWVCELYSLQTWGCVRKVCRAWPRMSWVLFSQKWLCNITQTLECFGSSKKPSCEICCILPNEERKGTAI